MDKLYGYMGSILEVDLTTGKIEKVLLDPSDAKHFVGGRGLGMKILWDKLKEPGVDPLSPENPVMFMPGPMTGYPFASSSRTCVVTKSPRTSALHSKYEHASTVSYSNMGGFIGPEIRFAGYDGIVVTGKASKPVYIRIGNDDVEIRDASEFWGMGTDEFDVKFHESLGDNRFQSCYIGPAGENMVPMASIQNTAARSAGRGGTGAVMGSKNLKAIAVKGTRFPEVADHKKYLELLDLVRTRFRDDPMTAWWRSVGTAGALPIASEASSQAVKNYREGTYTDISQIGAEAAQAKAWQRDFACYACPLSCKKSGIVEKGLFAGLVHDGPEYETGSMYGANLLISNLEGLLKEIFAGDDYGLDIISTGNAIGFLMEAYEKGYINKDFVDGIDLAWGNVRAVLEMLKKITYREGIGDLTGQGVKKLAEKIGRDSHKFAIHVKGHELAAWNVHVDPGMGISYVSSNRGACHINGADPKAQNSTAMVDSLGVCLFAAGTYGENGLEDIITMITGHSYPTEEYMKTGERIFNLEKMFNYREGFTRDDDVLPDRFYEEPLTMGKGKGAVLDRKEFDELLTKYYTGRGWDPVTSRPTDEKLKSLGLEFTME
jgi:aldehyde:ferredoxin oxidoreductase